MKKQTEIYERFNSRQAADFLGVSISTLYRMEDKGLVHCTRTPGGQRRFLKSDLTKYIQKSESIKAPQNPSQYKTKTRVSKEVRQRDFFGNDAFVSNTPTTREPITTVSRVVPKAHNHEYRPHTSIAEWLSEWEFRKSNTKTFTHGIHTYPAMFIPQVARKLILEFTRPGETVADIFCGSGTTIVESVLLGRNAIGIELNPLAILIAQVKTTPIAPENLHAGLEQIIETYKTNPQRPITFTQNSNLEFWFSKNAAATLNAIKCSIESLADAKVKRFFLVAFSEIVRKASFTKDNEFKLVRDKGKVANGVTLDLFGEFLRIARRNIEGMLTYFTDFEESAKIKIIHGDSTQANDLPNESVDFILTSPPYGDSRTTVAYGQFSRLSAQWLGLVLDERKDIDSLLLGGRGGNRGVDLHAWASTHSPLLAQSVNLVAERDSDRAKDVLTFFWDLNEALCQGVRVLKPNRYFAIVVGNRTVKDVNIKSDLIISELCEELDCVTHGILYRTIPNKRMPLENSPTNIPGQKSKTMHRESIVLLRKI